LYVASGVLGRCADSRLPKLAFLLPAVAWAMRERAWRSGKAPAAEAETASKAVEKPENMAADPALDDLSLEIGFQLIPLVDEKQAGRCWRG